MRTLRACVAAVVLAVGMSACRNNAAWVSEPVHPLGPTLQVVNNTSLEYRVVVGPGVFVISRPGQTACVRVGTNRHVRAIQVFALASSDEYQTPADNLMNAPGWILEIGQTPRYDVLSLRPAEPCMR